MKSKFCFKFLQTIIFTFLMISCASSYDGNRIPSSERVQIKASEFVAQLDKSGGLEPFRNVLFAQLGTVVVDESLKRKLTTEFTKIFRDKNWKALDHFPVIPLGKIHQIRLALSNRDDVKEMDSTANKPIPEKFSANLIEHLGTECTEKASFPKPVKSPLATLNLDALALTDGHFPDDSLDPCLVHQSLRLAEVLNSLMRADGSVVYYKNSRAQSTQQLIKLLIDSGHHVEMRNERTYANFISLNTGDNQIIWPVWLDTGLATKEGEPLRVPVGHSHHAWRISGPEVNARVMFYLGVSGVGYFAQVDERPAWTGLRPHYSHSSDNESSRVVIEKALKASGTYYRRILKESKLHANGMKADGYGYLGVCNDSNAVLEASSHKDERGQASLTVYPLLRSIELDSKPAIGDGLDHLINSFPNDSSGEKLSSAQRKAVLTRVYQMFPFENINDPKVHDETLRKQMQSLKEELGL